MSPHYLPEEFIWDDGAVRLTLMGAPFCGPARLDIAVTVKGRELQFDAHGANLCVEQVKTILLTYLAKLHKTERLAP